MKRFLIGLAVALGVAMPAAASNCSSNPYTLTNGSTADASQVMADFNNLLTCANNVLAPLASPSFTGTVTLPTINVSGAAAFSSTVSTGALSSSTGSFSGALSAGGLATFSSGIVLGNLQGIVSANNTGNAFIAGGTSYTQGGVITLNGPSNGGGVSVYTGTGGTNALAISIAASGAVTLQNSLSGVGATFTSNVIAPLFTANNSAGTYRHYQFQTLLSPRWDLGADNTTESGSNAGSNFYISRFTDAGAGIDTPLSINRATGLATLIDGLTVSGAVTANSGIVLTGTTGIQSNVTNGDTFIAGGNSYTSGAGIVLYGPGTGGGMSFYTGSGGTNALVGSWASGGLLTLNNGLSVTGTATATAFSGPLTGNVTGNISGALNGSVGATTPNTGAFTTLSASSTATLSGGASISSGVTVTGGLTADTASGAFVAAASDVLTGTATNKLVTPASLAGTNLSNSANGYVKLAGGLIVQWGSCTTVQGTSGSCSYPLTFPNGVYSVQVNMATGGTASAYVLRTNSIASTSSFSYTWDCWSCGAGNSFTTYWTAIGH